MNLFGATMESLIVSERSQRISNTNSLTKEYLYRLDSATNKITSDNLNIISEFRTTQNVHGCNRQGEGISIHKVNAR